MDVGDWLRSLRVAAGTERRNSLDLFESVTLRGSLSLVPRAGQRWIVTTLDCNKVRSSWHTKRLDETISR